MKNTKLLTFLRSNNFALSIAILSVIVQSFHSFTAFYNTSSLHNAWGIAQAVLFAIIIDLAIIFYTLRNRTDIAKIAALAMVIINAYYYYQHLGVTTEFIFGVFLSLIIPVSVYFYSEEIRLEESGFRGNEESFADAMDREYKMRIELEERCKDAENLGTLYAGKIDHLNGTIEKLEAQLAEAMSAVSTKLSPSEMENYRIFVEECRREDAVRKQDRSLKMELDIPGGTPMDNTILTHGLDIGLPDGDKCVETTVRIGKTGIEVLSMKEIDTRINHIESLPQLDDYEHITSHIARSQAMTDLQVAKRRLRLIDAIRNKDYYAITKIADEETKAVSILYDEAKEEYRKYIAQDMEQQPDDKSLINVEKERPYKGVYKTQSLPEKKLQDLKTDDEGILF